MHGKNSCRRLKIFLLQASTGDESEHKKETCKKKFIENKFDGGVDALACDVDLNGASLESGEIELYLTEIKLTNYSFCVTFRVH